MVAVGVLVPDPTRLAQSWIINSVDAGHAVQVRVVVLASDEQNSLVKSANHWDLGRVLYLLLLLLLLLGWLLLWWLLIFLYSFSIRLHLFLILLLLYLHELWLLRCLWLRQWHWLLT